MMALWQSVSDFESRCPGFGLVYGVMSLSKTHLLPLALVSTQETLAPS